MSERPLYVYRLEVEHPEGEPPMPPGWADENDRGVYERPPPTWPTTRRYLSQSGADARARLLRSMGCTVEVIRSRPVVFGE